jgi:hypothetical protein
MTDRQEIAVCHECLGKLVPTDNAQDCQVVREHAIWGPDYPSLEKVWENDEDDDLFAPESPLAGATEEEGGNDG